MAKKILCLVCGTLAMLAMAGCGGGSDDDSGINRSSVESDEIQFSDLSDGDTIAVFDTSLGEIRAVLYPDYAPMAVENFVGLCNSGYYNETVVFKAQAGTMVEGGDATGSGTAGTTVWNGNGFPAEYCDELRHYAGALCAAVDDTTGLCYSVFYIVAAVPGSVDDSDQSAMSEAGWRDGIFSAYKQAGGLPGLDYTDTVFGQVYEGMDVVDQMANAAVDDSDRPAEDIIIHSVTIETVGE